MTQVAPKVSLTAGTVTQTINLSPGPTTLAEACQRLENGIRAHPGAAFQKTIVAPLASERLLAIPGDVSAVFRFRATSSDATTVDELGLESDFFLIAANATGEEPGPVLYMERTTVLGRLHVKELRLASESIFASPVRSDRRKEGCVRFCFVAPGSRTPQRQPHGPPWR